jgi:hypothetical protein
MQRLEQLVELARSFPAGLAERYGTPPTTDVPLTGKGRRAPARKAPAPRIATVEEVDALADAVPPRYHAMIQVTAYGVLRWGSWPACAEQLLEVRGAVGHRPVRSEPPELSGRLPGSALVATRWDHDDGAHRMQHGGMAHRPEQQLAEASMSP